MVTLFLYSFPKDLLLVIVRVKIQNFAFVISEISWFCFVWGFFFLPKENPQ